MSDWVLWVLVPELWLSLSNIGSYRWLGLIQVMGGSRAYPIPAATGRHAGHRLAPTLAPVVLLPHELLADDETCVGNSAGHTPRPMLGGCNNTQYSGLSQWVLHTLGGV